MRSRGWMKVLVIGIGLTLVFVAGCSAPASNTSSSENVGGKSEGGHTILSNSQLTDVAPGLGTIMVEVGYRNWVMYYAAKGGNWDLAAYQAKELDEALETGEITRPNRKGALQTFSKNQLETLNAAITAKDSAQFMTAWTAEVKGCNDCHVNQKFSYIKWQLPATPPEDLTLSAVPTSSVEATTGESQEQSGSAGTSTTP